MNRSFELLPDTSRIWIYQSNRKFTKDEVAEIDEKAKLFLKTWNAHGNNLLAGATVLHYQFIILSVNEHHNGASGCSIDKSVKFIKELESTYDVRLLDRSEFAFLKHQEIHIASIQELKKKIDKGIITEDTLIFNNLVDKKGDLEDKWIIPAGNSWMKRYFASN